MQESTKGYLFAGTTALTWSFLAIFLKLSLNYVDAATVVFLRFVVAFLGLGIILLLRTPSQLRVLKNPPFLAILAGVLLAANYMGYMKGVELTSPGNAQIMIQLGPVSLALIGVFHFKEYFGKIQKFGFTIFLLGLGLFFQEQLTNALLNFSVFKTGNLWILMAALAWAIWGAFQKTLGHRMQPQQVNLVVYGVAALVFIPFANWATINQMSLPIWGFMLALGAITIISYGGMGEALKRVPSNHVSFIITLNPLLTLIFLKLLEVLKWNLFPAETIGLQGYVGAIVLVTGVTLVVGKRKTKIKEV